MILAMPTLEENIVLIQSSLFTLMIIVVCKLDYLMYIKYVNTGDSSLTAERSFLSLAYYLLPVSGQYAKFGAFAPP